MTTDTRTPFARSSSIPEGARPRQLDQGSPGIPGVAGGAAPRTAGAGSAHGDTWFEPPSRTAGSNGAKGPDLTKLAEATEENLVNDTKVNVRRFTYGQMKEVAAGIAKFLPKLPEDCSGATALVLVEAALPDMLHQYATQEPEEPNETSLVPAEQPPITVKVDADV